MTVSLALRDNLRSWPVQVFDEAGDRSLPRLYRQLRWHGGRRIHPDQSFDRRHADVRGSAIKHSAC